MLTNSLIDALQRRRSPRARLAALKKLKKILPDGERKSDAVNIQTHTVYSFSPYTPSMAAFMAYKFDLRVAGILDNYTVAGAREFIAACRILNLTYSVGVEMRADFKEGETPYYNVALLGVARRYFRKLNKDLAPYRSSRRENVSSTIAAVNKKLSSYGIKIDYKKDVAPLVHEVILSKYVYYALAQKLVDKFGEGEKICDFIAEALKAELTDTERGLLCDKTNPYYVYDLANIISDNYTVFHSFKKYPSPEEIVELAHSVGAVCSFEYVVKRGKGKKTDAELTEYNENLVRRLKKLRFDAISFDPSKFSADVLEHFKKLLKENNLLPLNLTRVEFPRRRFDCSCADKALRRDMTEAVYAIVGSEICENNRASQGFVTDSDLVGFDFEERVKLFSRIGRKGYDD